MCWYNKGDWILENRLKCHICIYVYLTSPKISLGTLLPNSRDRHEKQWRPDFTCHKTHPKICFV